MNEMKKFSEELKPSKPGKYNVWFSNIRSIMPIFVQWDGEKWILESWMKQGRDLHFYEP